MTQVITPLAGDRKFFSQTSIITPRTGRGNVCWFEKRIFGRARGRVRNCVQASPARRCASQPLIRLGSCCCRRD
eukprot:COSAG06_NODE_511_length_14869_cov_115.791063_7_plen_74_part_00